MIQWVSRGDKAEQLRFQAQNCRDLAGRTRTASGIAALVAAANLFEHDASCIDPLSEARL